MSALLSLASVTVMRGARAVLDDVSLEVRAGEIVGLLGPNGAGKSTLLRAALGLVPRARGTARVGDLDPATADRRAIARRAVLLPERAGTGSGLTVRDVVRTGRYAHVDGLGAGTAADREAVDRALEVLGLASFAERPFDALSAGERKRVLLARCVAQEAPLFLLDEPTSTLDLGHARSLFDAVRGRLGETGGALVAIHDLGLAALACDRLVLLHEGKVAAAGTPADVLSEERLARVFGARTRVELDAAEVRVRIPR